MVGVKGYSRLGTRRSRDGDGGKLELRSKLGSMPMLDSAERQRRREVVALKV